MQSTRKNALSTEKVRGQQSSKARAVALPAAPSYFAAFASRAALALAVAPLACGSGSTPSGTGPTNDGAAPPGEDGGGGDGAALPSTGANDSGTSSGGPGGAILDGASSGADALGGSMGADGAPTMLPPGRGASMPWDEYEAEQASTNANVLPASSTLGDVQAESSGRRAVRLEKTGDYVEFTATHQANSIVVRYSIPDAAGGGGMSSTLDLYVNGALRQAIPVTSKYSWFYNLAAWQNGGPSLPSKNPSDGMPFHYFDEAHALVGDIPAGAKVRLQKDAANAAAYYIVDLIDLEQAPDPLSKPANVLDIAQDCGATPDDGTDDGQKIQDCVTMAKSQGKGIWIPKGTFDLPTEVQGSPGIAVAGVAVQGAGMWYSVLHGLWAGFVCNGDNCGFSNFAILGETTTRDDGSPQNGFAGSAGKSSKLDHIWVEHKKVGFWVGENSPPNGVTSGLVVSSCRFRDLFADGVNFCNGTSSSEIVDTHFRYTGDDAAAAWSYTQPGPAASNNTIHHNTAQLPWRATCFALYGGTGNAIEDNVCTDTLTFPGIQIGGPYAPMTPFSGTTSVQRNTLVRAGGYSFNQQHGALKLFSVSIDDTGIVVSDIDIEQPTYFGIDLQSQNDGSQIVNSSMTGVQIASPGAYGIQVRAGARGSLSLSNVSVTNAGKGGLLDQSTSGQFAIQRGTGNSGW